MSLPLRPKRSKASPQVSKRKGKQQQQQNQKANVGYVSAGMLQSAMFTAAPGAAVVPSKLRESAPGQIESKFSPGLSETLLNSSIVGRSSMIGGSRASSPGSKSRTIQMDEHKQLKETDRPADMINSSDPDTSLLDYEDNKELVGTLRRTLTYSLVRGSHQENNNAADLTDEDITDVSDDDYDRIAVEEHIIAQTESADFGSLAPHNSIHLSDSRENPHLKQLADEQDNLTKQVDEAQLRLSQRIEDLATLTRMEKPRAVTPDQKLDYYKKLESSAELTLKEQETIIQGLEDRCANLEQQNMELLAQMKILQEEFKSTRRSTEGSDNLQISELKKENKFLQDQVYKLNVKLSICQTHHEGIEDVNGNAFTGLPTDAPTPAWLINHKYLSPLLKGYEDEIAAKNKQIKAMNRRFAKYDTDIAALVQENENLLSGMQGKGYDPEAIHKTAWKQLQQQARLVLEENEVLVKELDLQDEKMKQVHTNGLRELSIVEKRARVLEAERNALAEECAELKSNIHMYKSQYDEIRASSSQRVDRLEHTKIILDYKGKMSALEAHIECDKDKLREQISDIQAERDAAEIRMKEAQKESKQLETALASCNDTISTLQKKNGELQAHNQETTRYLSDVVKTAEHTMLEVDALAGLARAERKDKKKTVGVIVESELSREKLMETFRQYKKKAEGRIDHLGGKLDKASGIFDQERREYERQIKHLRLLVREKACEAQDAMGEKEQIEECLEIMWKSAKADNSDMRNSLRKSAAKSRRRNLMKYDEDFKAMTDDLELSATDLSDE